MIKLNETPVRTSRNFNINNMKLNDINIPEKLKTFNNLKIIGNIEISENIENTELTYGIEKNLINQVQNNSNRKIRIDVNQKIENTILLNFKFE